VTPLVCVHGFMGGSAQWVAQAPLGLERALICVDLPGFGRNAHLEPLTTIGGLGAWVLAELTERGIHRFDLLGHSMGGMVVQEMVHQAPHRVARLVLYGTGAQGALPGRFEPIDISKQRAQNDGAEATARRISATWFLQREAAAAYPACAEVAVQARLPALLAGLDAMPGWSGVARLGKIAMPTLILWGSEDRTYPWSQTEQLWRSIPGAQLAVVPNAAHAVHMERPALFNMLVDDFLKTAQPAPQP